MSGLQERDRRIVVDLFGEHRPHDRHVVGDASGVRQQFAQHLPRVAVRLESKLRRRHGEARLRGRHAGKALLAANRIRQFAGLTFAQMRLVVEQVQL